MSANPVRHGAALVLASIACAGILGSLVVFSPLLATGLILAACGLVCAIEATPLIPLGAFLITVIGIPYDVLLQYRVVVGSIPFNVADAVAILACVSLIRQRRFISLPSKLRVALVLFSVVMIGAAFIGLAHHNDTVLVVREFRYLAYMVLAALAFNVLGGLGHAQTVLKWAGAIVVIMQFSQVPLYLAGYAPALRNIHILAQFLPVLYVVGLGAAADLHPFGKSWKKWLGPLAAAAIVLSLTRTVWIQFALSLLLASVAIFRRSAKLVIKTAAVLVAALIVAAALAPQSIWTLVGARWSGLSDPFSSNDTLSFRITDSVTLMRKIGPQGALLGQGLGAEAEMYVVGISGQPVLTTTDYTENSVLFYLWKTGLPGILAVAWLVFVVLSELRRSNAKGQATSYAAFWGMVVFIAIGAWSGNLTPTQHSLFILAIPFGFITATAPQRVARFVRVPTARNVSPVR